MYCIPKHGDSVAEMGYKYIICVTSIVRYVVTVAFVLSLFDSRDNFSIVDTII